MEIRQLEYVVAVLNIKFTQAAKAIHLSQSSFHSR